MSDITIYSSRFCGYCVRAKQLLEGKGIHFRETMVDLEPGKREEMMERSGRRSVPQIFIGERHVGGFTDLWDLEQTGELDKLLATRSDDNATQGMKHG